MFEFVDPLVVAAAAAAGFVSGAIWYGVLGKYWLAALGKTREEIGKARVTPFIVAAAANMITAYFLAQLLAQFGVDNGIGGVVAAAMIWFGFIITFMATHHAFAGARITLTVIDGLHALFAMCVMGYVIGFMSQPGL